MKSIDMTPKENTITLRELAKVECVGAFRIDRDDAVKFMANEILGVTTYIQVGHKNGDTLDNRRCNLYIIDPERN